MDDKLPYPWNELTDETYWTLGGMYPNKKFKWKKRKKVPQEILDMLNGKPIKMKVNITNWKKGIVGSGE